jgi:hypothetical protein
MKEQATKLIEPLRLTSEFVFLNEHFGAGTSREKSGVKLFLNYQEKTYKIVPAHKEGKLFHSNILFFDDARMHPAMMSSTSVVARPVESFDFIGSRVPTSMLASHKAIALSLLEAIEFAEKELK